VQSEIRVGHVGIPRKTPDYFAVLVMNAILGGAFSSRLNLNLRERHGFTYSASSTFVMRRFSGLFLVSAAVQTEVTGAAISEMLSELDSIRTDSVTPSELASARQYVAGTFPLSLQTSDGVASKLAELATYDLPRSYLSEFSARILSVGEEQVLDAARTRIRPEALSILVLGDAATLGPQLEALQLAHVQIFGPEEP
jgi:zinc protease